MSTRQSTLGVSSANLALLSGAAGVVTTKTGVVSREEFVEHYPKFLIDVTVNFDPSQGNVQGDMDASGGWEGKSSVDIAFENLCLSVKVGDQSANIVNNVTGRVRARTMTALMGGSGAGKLIGF